MNKVWLVKYLGWIVCAIRRRHGPFRRPKDDENKYCRVCGEAVKINKRDKKIRMDNEPDEPDEPDDPGDDLSGSWEWWKCKPEDFR